MIIIIILIILMMIMIMMQIIMIYGDVDQDGDACNPKKSAAGEINH